MRLPVAVLVLAALPATAFAQNGPYLAVVADAEVRMRAGESDRFPDAGTLYRGTRVFVDHEESGGWLAIQAPPGSVSWVQMTFLEFDARKPLPENAMVTDEVTLVAGRVGFAQPLMEVRRTKVPAGTVLTVIGEKAVQDGKTYYPVAPPYGDFRYIPKSSVQSERAANTSFSVRTTDTSNPAGAVPAAATGTPGIAAPAGGFPTAPTGTARLSPTVNNPLWAQAETAEREGRSSDAERLYFELARVMNEPGGERDVADLCYTRIHKLREKPRTGVAASLPPAREDRTTLAPPSREAVTLPPAAKDTRPATTVPAAERGEWSKSAVLVKANIAIDGQQTYALETSPGNVLAYVIGASGLELERYKNRRIVVFGTTANRRGVSKPVIVATAVDPNTN